MDDNKFKEKLQKLNNDPFKILNLDKSKKPSKKEIKSAYKELVLKYHPDKNTGEET